MTAASTSSAPAPNRPASAQQPRGGRFAHELARALDRLAALDDLLADVEQAHAGRGLAVHSRHQGRAHDGELQQVLRRAIDVGTQVEHRGIAALAVGHNRGDGRPVDAVDRLQHVPRHRHQGTRVPGRHAGIGSGGAPGRLQVTDEGRFLIRNVCMVFDRYLGTGSAQPLQRMPYSRTI